ncbi:MAG: phage tail tape measure protein [Ruminococcus flavefaciens]|nr:phage tail tape measure protein [Ruminococcus flavefaciens]
MNDDLSVLIQAELDKSGIHTELKKIQEIVKKYHLELTPDLQTASLRNNFKSVCKAMANDFNKTFNTNVSGNDIFKVYSNKAKQLQQTIQQINNIKLLSSGGIKNDYATQLSVLEGKFSKLGLKEDEVNKKTANVATAFDELKKRLAQPFDESNYNEIIALNDKLQKEFIESQNEATRLNATMKMATDSSRLNQVNTMQKWADNNGKAMKAYGDKIRDVISQMGDLTTPLEKTKFDNLVTEFKTVQKEAIRTGNTGMTTAEKFQNAWSKIGGWSLVTTAFAKIGQSIRKMYNAVVDIDTAMTNLYKVTDETDKRYDKFLKSASKSAKELGRTISSLVEQTANWAKLGFSIDQAEELAKISSIYANVGEVDDDTAVSDMVTAMKAFNIEVSDAITIVDKLNKLGNEYATSAAALGDGLSRSASVMATSGTDLNKTLAMLTGGTEITQNASEFGNFLKIGSMRIRGMKGELEELGEEVDETVDSISKVQTQILNRTGGKVNIFDDLGNFRDYYDIMKDISEIYDDLSSTNKADLTEILFGKQRGNQGAALIQAFQSGQIQKALEATMNAEGSAMQEQERWLESIEAKTQQFEATFQSLSTTILNSDLVKWFVDLGTGVVSTLDKIIDKIGTLGTIGTIGGAMAGANNRG